MHTGVQPQGIDPNQIDASCKRLQELIDLDCPPTPVTIVGDEVEDWGLSCAAEAYGSAVSEWGRSTPQQSLTRFKGRRAEIARQQIQDSYDAIEDVLPLDPQPYAESYPSSQYILRPWTDQTGVVRDELGKVIMWPWETPNAVFGGATSALPKQQRVAHHTDNLIRQAMSASVASGDMGYNSTGVRAWRHVCESEHTPSDRPIDPLSPLWVKLQEERLAMRFVCALVKDRGVAVGTAACYFGQVQGWHAKEHGVKLAAGIKLSRLPAMLKGLRRIVGEAPRVVRRGIAPGALRKAMDLLLNPAVPAHANIRAALATALQGLLRSAEYACDAGVKWNPLKHLSRAEITECSEERLVLMMLPCKNMRHLTGKTVPLIIGAGGQLIDAVAEVRNMLAVDPVSPQLAKSTPLFRDPASNEPLRTSHVRDIVRGMMSAVGETTPTDFGTHSLRIGGATALFAAGADETVIRTMGRWSSDCYRLYVRACFETTLKWSRLAGSTQVHDLAGEFDEVDFY